MHEMIFSLLAHLSPCVQFLHDDVFKLNKDLNLLTKENKMKQKVNFILKNKNESLQTKILKLKEEVTALKKTKKNLER